MSDACCHAPRPSADPRYRRVLWIALVVNAVMFMVEVGASQASGSVALLADSVDFFADAANYGVSLAVLSMSLQARARASIGKAACMAVVAAIVLGRAAWSAAAGVVPEASTMGAVAAVALVANVGVAVLLYRWRSGDSNMRSVWLCTRNDAIGNVAVGLAALGVFGSGSGWPDLAVGVAMALLALSSAASVLRQARGELRVGAPA